MLNKNGNGHSPKIVVIDDNSHDCRLIRRLLHTYNFQDYEVLAAENGLDGIDLVRQEQPDLVILDVLLPEEDGYDTLAALKSDESTSDIPVFIVSAKSLSSDEIYYLRRYTESIWEKGNYTPADLVKSMVEKVGGDITRSPAFASVYYKLDQRRKEHESIHSYLRRR